MAEMGKATKPPHVTDKSNDVAVEAMVDWFLHNFEDPAENTPHESAEGGYQYIWGGPCDAKEELEEAFLPHIDHPQFGRIERLIKRAVKEVEDTGTLDWVPSSNRIQPDESDESLFDDDESDEGEGEDDRDRPAR